MCALKIFFFFCCFSSTFSETKCSISSSRGLKALPSSEADKMKIFQKSTEGQTPTLCFYILSGFCKHLEAFLKNHPSTHIHLLLHLCSRSAVNPVASCLASGYMLLLIAPYPDVRHIKTGPYIKFVCLFGFMQNIGHCGPLPGTKSSGL